jgi:hypothetical protein
MRFATRCDILRLTRYRKRLAGCGKPRAGLIWLKVHFHAGLRARCASSGAVLLRRKEL